MATQMNSSMLSRPTHKKDFGVDSFGCEGSWGRKQNKTEEGCDRGILGWQEVFCIEGLNMFMPFPVCQSGPMVVEFRSSWQNNGRNKKAIEA